LFVNIVIAYSCSTGHCHCLLTLSLLIHVRLVTVIVC